MSANPSVTEILARAGLVDIHVRPEKCCFCKDAPPTVKIVKRNGQVRWLCRECLDACGMTMKTLQRNEDPTQ